MFLYSIFSQSISTRVILLAIGVTTLLIRGFNFVEDAIAYGREAIPLVCQAVQRREELLGATIFSARFLEVPKPFDEKQVS